MTIIWILAALFIVILAIVALGIIGLDSDDEQKKIEELESKHGLR